MQDSNSNPYKNIKFSKKGKNVKIQNQYDNNLGSKIQFFILLQHLEDKNIKTNNKYMLMGAQ